MRVGAAAIDITPPVGTALDGYGGRTDVSLGVHDPLYARALYLDDGTRQLALVVCDLIGIGSFLAKRARELIAERPGIAPENVLISATHTHAGPAGVRGRGEPVLVEETARKIAGAVRVAHRDAVEARLKYGVTELTSIAQNRRDPAGCGCGSRDTAPGPTRPTASPSVMTPRSRVAWSVARTPPAPRRRGRRP